MRYGPIEQSDSVLASSPCSLFSNGPCLIERQYPVLLLGGIDPDGSILRTLNFVIRKHASLLLGVVPKIQNIKSPNYVILNYFFHGFLFK